MHNATVLIIGAGGREHALAWALARSPEVGRVYVAPGNAGTALDIFPHASPVPHAMTASIPMSVDNTPALIDFARERRVDLTVVGPEAVLATGMVDDFQAAGLPIFGPTRAATMLESSKAFARSLMREHSIPTPAYVTFDSYEEAQRFLDDKTPHFAGSGIVVKADGLAAGKGVVVCATYDEAQQAIRRIMAAREFGAAGDAVVLEERLIGREVSLMAFCDGRTVVPMPPARDHKRVFEDDQGPNTGGMGAYAPPPDVPPAMVETLTRQVLQPAVDGMAARGTPYVGILYAGLMFTADAAGGDEQVRVLEYNCRFGDPEAQVVLPLLDVSGRNASLYEILLACVEGRLDQVRVAWKPGACATVVLTSQGYPGAYDKGMPISGVEQFMPGGAAASDDIIIFHAGTALQNRAYVTAGGRVLNVSALGVDLPTALRRAYTAVERISFAGMHYRRDIGRRELVG